MACNHNKAGKRKGRDPELSQLLKLVLAKLGSGDSDSGEYASDGKDNRAGTSRPRGHMYPPPDSIRPPPQESVEIKGRFQPRSSHLIPRYRSPFLCNPLSRTLQ
ncbi:hypothetical protein NDU88_003115 [Pleurodeles waltl]|uniref:Uncharacterized protein n=1 Tax=Pleurodeles waltl TaxID=8319 RepID=A0AAV7SEF9_PLEWA|nr:hypothetical protein NDU88_003115 [Pleurodeles waltl]